MRAPARAETETGGREVRLQDRLQDLQNGLLNQTVDHRWDAQLAHPAARLRDLHPLDRLWSVVAPHQLGHQHILVVGDPGAQVGDGHAVHPRRPLVRLHPLVSLVQVGRGGHPLHQVLRQGSLLRQRRECL